MKRKILITGAGGFIGSHLVERCVELGHDVEAFVHYNSNNNWGWLEQSPAAKEIKVISGDVRDYDSVLNAVQGKDTVFHLAALIGIPYSYTSPKAYIDTNIVGTYNILQAAREKGLSQVLITSTSETYGTAQYVPIDEKHPSVGQSPYSASKISADQIAISFYRSFSTPVKIVRPFNTFGPRQSARAFIPTVISQILSGKKELSLGNLTPTRDFTFVRDTVEGFLEIAQADSLLGEAVNIGMKSEISMENTVHLIAELIGTPVKILTDSQRVRPEKSEVERLLCENEKIQKNTKWAPRYNLRQGLQETIEWIKKNPTHYKPDQYNV